MHEVKTKEYEELLNNSHEPIWPGHPLYEYAFQVAKKEYEAWVNRNTKEVNAVANKIETDELEWVVEEEIDFLDEL